MTDTWLPEPEKVRMMFLPKSNTKPRIHLLRNNFKRHKSCPSEPRNKWNEMFLLKTEPKWNKSDKNKYQIISLTYGIKKKKKRKTIKTNSYREETSLPELEPVGRND